ncbi:hypothetical protein CspHIS471_0411050 [Cutaneotrichosporon sp. HIS471]|nr:hypothetical protein CspHIS471_0411050 [Cutaneotrichosporon sp. HIS471]
MRELLDRMIQERIQKQNPPEPNASTLNPLEFELLFPELQSVVEALITCTLHIQGPFFYRAYDYLNDAIHSVIIATQRIIIDLKREDLLPDEVSIELDDVFNYENTSSGERPRLNRNGCRRRLISNVQTWRFNSNGWGRPIISNVSIRRFNSNGWGRPIISNVSIRRFNSNG